MEIKKHKIKVFSEDQTSDFVVDLRSDKKQGKLEPLEALNAVSDLTRDDKTYSNIGDNFIDNNTGKIGKKFKNPFIFFLKSINFKKIRKTFLFPFFLFFFKIIKAIVLFFVDWIVDIIYFFKKLSFFKKFNLFNKRLKKKINTGHQKIIQKTENGAEHAREDIKNIKKEIKNDWHDIRNFKKITQLNFRLEDFNYKNKKKSILVFILLLFLLIVPFKMFSYYKLVSEDKTRQNLLQYSFDGLDSFMSASSDFSDLNLGSAQRNFFQAGQNFLLLEEELKKIDEFIILLASFSSNKEIRLASESKNIAKLGIHISLAGDNFSLAINSLINGFSDQDIDNSDRFSDFYYYSQKAEDEFKKASKYLKKIKPSAIPDEYRDQFISIQEKTKILEKNFSNFLKIIPGLKDFLGVDFDRRYLIVFQNNYEIRATGGFIGSYALVDFKKGRISNIEIPSGGSYDTEGGMRVLIESPKPLHLVRPIWHFWDANWWPDWKVSAQNLMWFYEKSGGSSVDGVISITPDVLGDVLKLIGPIDLVEKYGVIINSDNFWEIIQEIVEVIGQPELYNDKNLQTDILNRVASSTLQDKLFFDDINNDNISFENYFIGENESQEKFLRNEPKKIIGDLMTEILHYFSNNVDRDLLIKTFKILENNLSKKNILLYFSNQEMQQEAENRSWAGRIKTPPLDYMMIVDSNIAGGKTDKFINNNFWLNVRIDSDGSIVNKLIINKKHLGEKDGLFSGVRNVNWLRVYVPLGSTLINAKGFLLPDKKYFKEVDGIYDKHQLLELGENRSEIDALSGTKIYQELEKTVFANWTMVNPGEEIIVEIEYKLPYNFDFLLNYQTKSSFLNIFKKEYGQNYSLLWQKQPGSHNANFNFNFENNLGLQSIWTYPDNLDLDNVGFSGDLVNDRYLVIMLDKINK